VVALDYAVMNISGSTFHLLLIILSISGVFLIIIIRHGILSLQYVCSMNCIVRLSLYYVGGGD
jgi:hypothetical protein